MKTLILFPVLGCRDLGLFSPGITAPLFSVWIMTTLLFCFGVMGGMGLDCIGSLLACFIDDSYE
jgi:hypothetical protein